MLGKDLDAVRHQYGLLVSDACWLFGLSMVRWGAITKAGASEPVNDPTLALLVRFLADHPELSVIPKFPSASEMYETVNEVMPTGPKRFSVLFGSETTATYRWLHIPGSRQSGAVGRLMHYLKVALLAERPDQRRKLLEEWCATVEQEGRARGVPDVFKAGGWNPNRKSPVRRRRRKGGAEGKAAADDGSAAEVNARSGATGVPPDEA